MARPRAHSDAELLAKVGGSIASANWTLVEAAAGAGVSPATLIKRFGSRRGVLEALSRNWVESLPVAPQGQGGVGELRDWLLATRPGQRRSEAVAGLGMLIEDLRDDGLTDLLIEGWTRQRSYLAALVASATRRGELTRPPDPWLAAQLLLDVVHGALIRAAASTRPENEPSEHPSWEPLLEGWK